MPGKREAPGEEGGGGWLPLRPPGSTTKLPLHPFCNLNHPRGRFFSCFLGVIFFIDTGGPDPVLPVGAEDGHGEQRGGVRLRGYGQDLERRAQVHPRPLQEGACCRRAAAVAAGRLEG